MASSILLSAWLLDQVTDVNHFVPVTNLQWAQGDTPTIYFQLIDATALVYNNPPGRRWIPPAPLAGYSQQLVGIMNDVNLGYTNVFFCTNPFSQDLSIFMAQPMSNLPPTTPLLNFMGTYGLKLILEQGPNLTQANPVNPTANTLATTTVVPATTPQVGNVYVTVGGVVLRVPYSSWAYTGTLPSYTGTVFTFSPANAPIPDASTTFWVVVPPFINGFLSQALSIVPSQSQY